LQAGDDREDLAASPLTRRFRPRKPVVGFNELRQREHARLPNRATRTERVETRRHPARDNYYPLRELSIATPLVSPVSANLCLSLSLSLFFALLVHSRAGVKSRLSLAKILVSGNALGHLEKCSQDQRERERETEKERERERERERDFCDPISIADETTTPNLSQKRNFAKDAR